MADRPDDAPDEPKKPGPDSQVKEPSNVRPSGRPLPKRKPEPSHVPGDTMLE